MAEKPFRNIFNSHLLENLNHIPAEARVIESKWAMFHSSIVKAAALICGVKVVGASRGGHPRTLWWTTWVRVGVKLKESYWALLTGRTPGAVEEYQQAKRPSLTVAEAMD